MSARIERSLTGKPFLVLDCLPHDGPTTCCWFPLSTESAKAAPAMTWKWDGNETAPTITPSVQCQACGLHVVVTRGTETGRPKQRAKA